MYVQEQSKTCERPSYLDRKVIELYDVRDTEYKCRL